MKTIVVAGAASGVGKTTLALELAAMLPGAVAVKIGHGARKPAVGNVFYPAGTPYADIARRHADAPWLVVESNSVLAEMAPDCVLFLDGAPAKPSAAMARARADVVSGSRVSEDCLHTLAGRLGLGLALTRRMAWLAGGRPEPVAAVVLAGGRSSRMGTDKAALPVDGVPMVQRTYNALLPHFDTVLVSVGRDGRPLVPGAQHVPDQEEGKGPLMALYSSLAASPHRLNFAVACDVPCLDLQLIRQMLALADSHAVVTPSFSADHYEPLYAVYDRSVAPQMAALLSRDRLRIADLFAECNTCVLPWARSEWYANLNTPEDYRAYITGRHKP